MTQRWSMRTRFVAAASLCLLPLLGVVLYILDQSLTNSRAQLFDTETAFAEVVSRGITQTLEENQDVLANLAANDQIVAMNPDGAQEVLGQAKELRPSVSGFFLLSPEGTVVAYSGGIDPQPILDQVQPAADIALTSGEVATTNTLAVPDIEVGVFAMIYPVTAEAKTTDEGGTPVGAMRSFISIDRLQRAFMPVTGESDSRTSVALVADGMIIANQGTPSNDTIPVLTDLRDPVKEAVAGNPVRVTYEDSSGDERLAVLAPVEYPATEWAVIVSGPSPMTYGPNRNLLRNGLIALAAATALTLLLAVIFGELTARPLRQLTRQAGAIASGDLEGTVEPVGRGEVAMLSASVRGMADQLTSQVRDMEGAREELELQRDLMRELLRRTVRLQEDERRRIASDIHDAVSPLITGALFQVRAETLQQENGNGNGHGDGEESDNLAEAANLLQQSMDELHNVVFALRPPDLDDLGVEAAISRYVQQINRTGLPSHLEVIGEQRRLSPESRLGVYRIVQEALHNSLRHAHADEAVVKLEWLDDRMRVSVRDNGSGFDPDSELRVASLGLLSMRERAAAIGATLEIVSRLGAGTIVVLERPWENVLISSETSDESEAGESTMPSTTNGVYEPADAAEVTGVTGVSEMQST